MKIYKLLKIVTKVKLIPQQNKKLMSTEICANISRKSPNEMIPLNHRIVLHNRPVSGSIGDIELNVWEWPGKPPTILFCHGASFNGRCFDEIISNLPGQHIITFDLRGHGYSSKTPPYSFRVYSEDLSKFIEKFDIEQAIGIGHSLGGYAITLASILNPNAFSALILLDPVFFPKSILMQTITKKAELSLSKILERRNSWSSVNEMFNYCTNIPIFRKWSSSMLQNYCTYGLLPKQQEDESSVGFIRACSNETEYLTYLSAISQELDIYERLAEIKIPVHVVRSGYPYKHGKFDTSQTLPDLVTYFKNGRDTKLEGVSHFIPMEVPSVVSDLIKDILRETENLEDRIKQ